MLSDLSCTNVTMYHVNNVKFVFPTSVTIICPGTYLRSTIYIFEMPKNFFRYPQSCLKNFVNFLNRRNTRVRSVRKDRKEKNYRSFVCQRPIRLSLSFYKEIIGAQHFLFSIILSNYDPFCSVDTKTVIFDRLSFVFV